MKAKSEFRVRSNVRVSAVDPSGRIVYDYSDHNIFLDVGRTWLMQALGYDTDPSAYTRVDWPAGDIDPEPGPSAIPPIVGAVFERTVAAPVTTAGIRMPWLPFYIGLGVGGNQQSGPIPADVDVDYPGTNSQSDADPTVTGLERPVRVLLEGVNPPTKARWLNPISTYTPQPGATPYTSVRYVSTFSASDINTGCRWTGVAPGDFAVVPLSEAAIYPWSDSADFGTVRYVVPPPPAPPAYATGHALAYFTFPTLGKTNAMIIIVQWDFICV